MKKGIKFVLFSLLLTMCLTFGQNKVGAESISSPEQGIAPLVISLCPLYGLHEAVAKGTYTVYDSSNNYKGVLVWLFQCDCGARLVTKDGNPATTYNPSVEHYSTVLTLHTDGLFDYAWYSVNGFSYLHGLPAGWTFFYA